MINSAADKPQTTNPSASLEDRHFLSDPRPVPGLDLPTWEVDVHREGVEQPILTLRVDSKVLPPRKKKKKTIWKLPDSVGTNPKFGEQDKRRILELFREKKKELKKLKNKQRAYRRASSIEAMNSGKPNPANANANSNANSNATSTSTSPTPKNLPPETNGQPHSLPNGVHSKVVNNNDVRDDPSLSPPGFAKLSISDPDNNTHSTNSLPPAPPPGISSSSPLKPAPPGLPSKNQRQQSTGSTSTSQAPPPPGLPQNGLHAPHYSSQPQSPPTPPPPPGLANGHHKHEAPQPHRAVGPCFVLPPGAPPGASMGKFVTETYYLLLRNGLIRDLDAYYYQSPSASSSSETSSNDDGFVYKAVTVGGAHAVCTSQQDRLVQLNTFAGCEMRIKGVQQQPTVGKGMLVLITGVNIRTTTVQAPPGANGQAPHPQPQQQLLPFCHTLILTPVSTTTAVGMGANPATSAATTPTIGYQILNDNLVILTGDE